jgi:hypothetical protein
VTSGNPNKRPQTEDQPKSTSRNLGMVNSGKTGAAAEIIHSFMQQQYYFSGYRPEYYRETFNLL